MEARYPKEGGRWERRPLRPHVAEGENDRLVAWADELTTMHARLRQALAATQETLENGAAAPPFSRDLLLICHGFCTALTGHHEGEDRHLFPAVAAAHPELGDALTRLTQDHTAIALLVSELESAIAAPGSDLHAVAGHLDGLAAIVESHFRYEERVLGTVLQTLHLDTDPSDVLGPL